MGVVDKLNPFARFRKVWHVFKSPATPLWAKVLFGALAGLYVLSPIDLLPDVVPIAGFLDDVVVFPLLIWLATTFAPRVKSRMDGNEPAARR